MKMNNMSKQWRFCLVAWAVGMACAMAQDAPDPGEAAPPPPPPPAADSVPQADMTAPAVPVPPPVPEPAAASAPAVVPPVMKAYTVKSGDNLWKIAKKHKVTVAAITAANNLATDALKIGQVLQIPEPGQAVAAAVAEGTPPGKYRVKEGDSLWKISAELGTTVDAIKKANKLRSNELMPGQLLTIPEGAAGAVPPVPSAPAAPAPPPSAEVAPPVAPEAAPAVAPESGAAAPPEAAPEPAAPEAPPPDPGAAAPAEAPQSRATPPSPEERAAYAGLRKRIVAEVEALAKAGVGYNRRWRPPGEREPWVMDCSNTTRYIYRRVLGVDIGRTASDQYYFLAKAGRAWRAPLDEEGLARVDYLEARLRAGDLLFWEHTYKPKRNPPITHVMIFLGVNGRGQWLMAGSQVSGLGGNGNHSGGPDIYVFEPRRWLGGYSSFLGLGRVRGRFVAHGRPLMAG